MTAAPTDAVLAPTEAEIRAHLEAELREDGSLNAAGELSDAFGRVSSLLDGLYDAHELRASEEQALGHAGYDAIQPILQRALEESLEALVAAGIRFATDHPGAPRALEAAPPTSHRASAILPRGNPRLSIVPALAPT